MTTWSWSDCDPRYELGIRTVNNDPDENRIMHVFSIQPLALLGLFHSQHQPRCDRISVWDGPTGRLRERHSGGAVQDTEETLLLVLARFLSVPPPF